MIRAGKSSSPRSWAAVIHIISFFVCLFQPLGASAVVYSDGKSHTINTSLDDFVSVRSSSTLSLPAGDYTIRSSSGSDSAIRLSMSSLLNATGGDVIGGDATDDHAPAVGVIVGSASQAHFWDGATVRGGNHLGAAADVYYSVGSSSRNLEEINYESNANGQGGDALVSQHFGSNTTIYGGNFMAGKGSAKDGHSLHAFDEGLINVHGGNFYGSWMARGRGSIVVTGCVSRIGTRLVGRLQDGLALDVQLIEEDGGEIILNNREKCDTYRKSHGSSNAIDAVGSSYYPLLGVVLLCLRFALV